MGCDLDFQNIEVREELINWGKWYLDTTNVDGFRIDAIKHISSWFFPEWHDAMEKHAGKELFMVGEYWSGDTNALLWYIDDVGGRLNVFDVPLHFNFYNASKQGSNYDLTKIFDNTIVQRKPSHAVTFVDNHDSQPLQALESTIEEWFKPIAYAFILLRTDGYPCVFYPDYYGTEYTNKNIIIKMKSFKYIIDIFLKVRRENCFGLRIDYFDFPNTIGWTYINDKPVAILINNSEYGTKWMDVRKRNTLFKDITGNVQDLIETNNDGCAEFKCLGKNVSIWIES